MLVDSCGVFLLGLQIHSVNGAAVGGEQDNITDGWYSHTDSMYLQGNILYAGGQGGVVSTDAGTIAINNTFIYNGTSVPCYGLFQKFEGTDAFNTFMGPGLSNKECAAILDQEGAFYARIPVQKYNNAIFGFAVPWAIFSDFPYSPGEVGANNITDVPASYVSSTWTTPSSSYTGQQLVGTSVNSASASAAFVNPTIGASLDLRVKNVSSPLYGTGAAFTSNTGNPSFISYPPAVDIFNQSRPSSGPRYDVGAEQFR